MTLVRLSAPVASCSSTSFGFFRFFIVKYLGLLDHLMDTVALAHACDEAEVVTGKLLVPGGVITQVATCVLLPLSRIATLVVDVGGGESEFEDVVLVQGLARSCTPVHLTVS